VHVPQLRRSVFEYEDLIFRQILAQGDKIKIVGWMIQSGKNAELLHESAGAGIRKPITATAFKELPPVKPVQEKSAIAIDEKLRNRLKDFTYSFSSLTKILACPFLFYHQYILGWNLLRLWMMMENKYEDGSLVHKFLYQLSTGPKEKFDDWEKLFDRLWKVMKTPM